MKARLIWITPDAEGIIAYCARVSNPANQANKDIAKLLKYCIKKKHWSVFEMANACFEVETSRAITAQIARHHSLHIQEFSQRYAKVQEFEPVRARRQDEKNRQNSIDDLPEDVQAWWKSGLSVVTMEASFFYEEALKKGIAKECARMALPMCSKSRMYLNGTIRSWITYLMARMGEDTQKEHRDVSFVIRDILAKELPTIAEAAGWTGDGIGEEA